MKNVESRGPQRLFVAALLVWLLALAGTRMLSPTGVADSIWPGFATFLVPSSYNLTEVDSALNAAGIESYVGAETTRFGFNDFGPLSTVKLSELESRFDRRDPRLDPYMQSVANYFQAQDEDEAYHVIYLPGNAGELMKNLGPAMQEFGIPLLSADSRAPNSVLLPFLVLCAIGGATALSDRRSPFVLAAGLPLLAVTIRTGDPFGVAAGFLIYLSWAMSYPSILGALSAEAGAGLLLSPDTRTRSGFRARLVYLGAAAVLALVLVLWHSPHAALGWLLTLVALGAASAAGVAVERRRVAVREHGVFEPIAILPRRLRPRRPPRDIYLAPLGALLVLLLVPAVGSERELSIPALPQPVNAPAGNAPAGNAPAAGATPVAVAAVAAVDAKHLPTIEHYLAHRAFQEAFMYGWEFRLPERGEDLLIPEFERNNGRIERRDRVAFSFDEDWIGAELDAIHENGHVGVESMLIAAGSPYGVEYRPVRHVYWARSELIRTVIPAVLLVLVPAVVHLGALLSALETGDRVTHLFYKRRNIEVV